MRLRCATSDEYPEEHSSDVGIENGSALSEGEAPYGAGRVLADALERQQRRFVATGASRRSGRPIPGDRMKPARTDVVAERAPRFGDVRFVGRGQRRERRVLRQPLAVLRQHAIHLGLLQHYFRHEDVIRIASLPPRQIAAVPPVPFEEPSSKTAAIGRSGQWQRALRRVSSRSRFGSLGHVVRDLASGLDYVGIGEARCARRACDGADSRANEPGPEQTASFSGMYPLDQ